MVEFTLPAHGDTATEFVNGAYMIGRILTGRFGGREIVYGEGSACLDNSCCGNYVCSYLMIYGERISTAIDPEAFRVRSIDDAQLAKAIRLELSRSHPGEIVNFFQPPHEPHHVPNSMPPSQPATPCLYDRLGLW